jgi:catechol 2,3-dioxygenase-like lactoylglutathione lyase family enzyme
MEVNGIAHVFLTASNFERSREFYRTHSFRVAENPRLAAGYGLRHDRINNENAAQQRCGMV